MTQNIDGLHRAAGTRDLIEVHGSIASSSCLACDARPSRSTRSASGSPRRRTACRAARPAAPPLKPDVVLFGELLPLAALERASELAASADLLLCVGSSLEVHPVAGLPRHARRGRGGGARHRRPDAVRPAAAVKLGGDVVAELDAVLAAL